MSISAWWNQNPTPRLGSFDYAIIGGGIAGLSTAYWLQKEDPTAKIVLVERYQVGAGASGRNAGFLTCGSIEHFARLCEYFGVEKAAEIWRFSEKNRELILEHIVGDEPASVDFDTSGAYTVAFTAAQEERFQSTAMTMKSQGIQVEAATAERLYKELSLEGFQSGIFYSGDGRVHPLKLLRRLRNQCKITLLEHTEVQSVSSNAGDVEIHTQHGTLKARHVFMCLNGYLPLVAPEYSQLIIPQRNQALVTEPVQTVVRALCYATHYLSYFRQLPSGALLIGGFRNLEGSNSVTYGDQITEEIQLALEKFLERHIPRSNKPKIAYRWSGVMGFTPDGQMMIGRAPHHERVSIMAGCSGHGMGLSFHAARVLVGDYFGRPVPAHLKIERFHSDIPKGVISGFSVITHFLE